MAALILITVVPTFTFAASCPSLVLGSRGTDVLAVQKFLVNEYSNFGAGNVTGYFGSLTQAAVKQWQAEHDIEQAGTVGPQTRAAMHLTCTATNPAPVTTPTAPNPVSGSSCPQFTRTLSLSMRGSDVQSLQSFFVKQGVLTSDAATSYFGSLTQGAVQAWQRLHTIVSSGTPLTTGYGAVGKRTAASIISACGASPSPVATTTPPTVITTPPLPITPIGGGGGNPTITACVFNGQTIPSGGTVTMYKDSVVPRTGQCASETRTCSNGILSGSYAYTSCSVSQSSTTCMINDPASLKECFAHVDVYDTFALQNDISCTGSNCCTPTGAALMSFVSTTGKTIIGNGHTFTRHGGQLQCPALSIKRSSHISVSDISIDEDESVAPCNPQDNCPATAEIRGSNDVRFDKVSVYNGKAYVVYVWGVDGFTFTNSVISNAGIIGLYIGNVVWQPSSNITVSHSIFSRVRTNALVSEGVGGTNIIDHNVFTRSHYFGLWPTPNTSPSFGKPSNGGEVGFVPADNLQFTNNIITDGYCDNCWSGDGTMWGVEFSDYQGHIAHAISLINNIFSNITGNAFWLDQGSDGTGISALGNTVFETTGMGNLLNIEAHNTNMSTTTHTITNKIYRIGGPNGHIESPTNISGKQYTLEGTFSLAAAPRPGASAQPLYRCFKDASNDYVSSIFGCGSDTFGGILGFGYESSYPGVQPFYACSTTGGDHFVSWSSMCEGQTLVSQLGYAVPN